MGLFATLTRKAVDSMHEQRGPVVVALLGLPVRFEAVGEALATGAVVHPSCAVVGRSLARDGAGLGEALSGLQFTYARVVGREPDFAATKALSEAWGEETLAYVHQLSCENPMTGLASVAHVRARLSEVYRGVEQWGGSVATSHALVVIDLPLPGSVPGQRAVEGPLADRFAEALWLVRVAETARTVFPGHETIGQVGRSRLVVLTDRSEMLGHLVSALRQLIEDVDPRGRAVHVWIEGLPAGDDAAASLLDELTRV